MFGAKRSPLAAICASSIFLRGNRTKGGERVGAPSVPWQTWRGFCGALFLGAEGQSLAGKRAAAFADRFVEESLGDGRSHLLADGEGTGAFAEDRDVAGIATKLPRCCA